MKRLLILLISLVSSVAAFGQAGSLSQSGIFLRVNDTTTYQASATGKHAQGYRDIYFNNQATTKHFDIWNGSSYDHIFDFMSGSGGGGGGSDLTWQSAQMGTTYTVTDADNNTIIPISNALGCTITLPNTVSTNTTVTFVRLAGSGTITFALGGTATLHSKGDEVTLESDNSWASWSKRTSTEWHGTGSLGPDGGGGGGGGSYTFTASDFNESGSTVSIDYTNGQAASASNKGFLTSSDWSTFNDKASTTYTDAKVADAINDGTTTVAPSQNAVFDALALKSNSAWTVSTKTTSYTLASGDLTTINAGGKLQFSMNAAASIDFNIPTNATVAIPIGTKIYIFQYGAGQCTVIPLSGVTLRSALNANKTYTQYSEATLTKIATDEWILSGDITP